MAQRLHLRAVAGYVLLTSWVLWPAIVGFTSRPMTSPADGSVFRWAWWAMPEAIRRGDDPYETVGMFHPVGADLSATTSAPLVSAASWPLQQALGSAAQVNAVQLASMLLAAVGAYLLAHHVCGDRRPALLAGLAYALLPHRFVDVSLGHLNLVHIGLLPLVVLAFLRLLDEPSRRRTALLGATLGATFLVDPQLAVLAVFTLVPLGVVRRRDVGEVWRRLLGAALLAFVVAAPLLVPLAGATTSGESGPPPSTAGSMLYSSSLLSWVVPPLDQLWIGHLGTVEPLTPTLEGIAYPGLVVIALAGAGVALRDRGDRRGWVAVAAVGIVLSFGPRPYVRGTFVDVPLPFVLVRAVPGMDAFRVPGRFAVVGALGLVVLAACGLAALVHRHPRRATALTVAACAVTLVELLPRSLPEAPREAATPYTAIADHRDPGAVLEIPLQWSTGQDAIGYAGGRDEEFVFLLNAIEHGRPTVSGAVSRYSDERLDRLLDIDLYRQVLTLQGEPGFEEPIDFDRTDLAELGIAFIAYDRSDAAPKALAHIRSLDLPVLADDGTVIVWWVDG